MNPRLNTLALAALLASLLAAVPLARGGVVLLDSAGLPPYVTVNGSIHPVGATAPPPFSDYAGGPGGGIVYAVDHHVEDRDAQLLAAGGISVRSAASRDAVGNFTGFTEVAAANAAAAATTDGTQPADAAYAVASFRTAQTLVFNVPNDGQRYIYSFAAAASAEGDRGFASFQATA